MAPPPLAFGGHLDLFWGMAARNIGRARRRTPRRNMNLEPTALDDGTPLHAPSGDEDTPAPLSGALALHPPCGFSQSS